MPTRSPAKSSSSAVKILKMIKSKRYLNEKQDVLNYPNPNIPIDLAENKLQSVLIRSSIVK